MRMFMNRLNPEHFLGLLHCIDVQIHHHRLVVAAHEYAFQRFVGERVDFLMRHVRRHEDEITRSGFSGKFQMIAPLHARLAAHDVDHAFKRAVMMRSGFRIRMDRDRAGPDFLGAYASSVDCGRPIHSGRLWGIRIELIALDHLDAVLAPVGVLVLMFVAHFLRLRRSMKRLPSIYVTVTLAKSKKVRCRREATTDFFHSPDSIFEPDNVYLLFEFTMASATLFGVSA